MLSTLGMICTVEVVFGAMPVCRMAVPTNKDGSITMLQYRHWDLPICSLLFPDMVCPGICAIMPFPSTYGHESKEYRYLVTLPPKRIGSVGLFGWVSTNITGCTSSDLVLASYFFFILSWYTADLLNNSDSRELGHLFKARWNLASVVLQHALGSYFSRAGLGLVLDPNQQLSID